MRLIDADGLGIGKANPSAFEKAEYAHGWNSAIEIIQNAPTIEAEPVVRCKDCKWFSYCSYRDCMRWKANDFCSRGERRADNEAD